MSDNVSENVWVGGTWYGPDYPDAGDPPKVTNKAATERVLSPEQNEALGRVAAEQQGGVEPTRGRPKRHD